MKWIPNCFICDSPGVLDSEIYSHFSERSFQILFCKSCELGWISNPNTDFEYLYNEEYYRGEGADPNISYWQSSIQEKGNIFSKIKNLEYSGILKTLNSLEISSSSIEHLDFGGGLGGLSSFLMNADVDSCLFENGYAASYAKSNGVKVVSELDQEYDIVTSFEVFEHLIEPIESIKSISGAVKKNGYLIITTGNLGKHKGPIAEWDYVRFNPDVHVLFFSPKSMEKLLLRFGFVRQLKNFHSELIVHKIINHLVIRLHIHQNKPALKVLYALRYALFPLARFADKKKGTSEIGIYKKIS